MNQTKKVATITAIALYGFEGAKVAVEADMRAGLPSLQIIGMGNKAVDEARHRVRGAILNSGLAFPPRKLVINLSPAELPKHGTSFDLAIAISILQVSGQLRAHQTADTAFVGELSLDGALLVTRGVTLAVEAAKRLGLKRVYVPYANKAQAALITGITIITARSLQEVFQQLMGIPVARPAVAANIPTQPPQEEPPLSFEGIAGQEAAKRALSLAIAGRHNILLYGPPGTGKTHLARAAASLLPDLSPQEVVDVTKITTITGASVDAITRPPFRAPHHAITRTALVGGGAAPHPGEISLAHKGVLFLDELPEYPRETLEALRQPLEDKSVTLSRVHGSVTYPADCILIATMNPCPCGFYGDPARACTCNAWQRQRYVKKLSGPLIDRIDLFAAVDRHDDEYFFDTKSLTKKQHQSEVDAIISIRSLQYERYNSSFLYNGNATHETIKTHFHVDPAAHTLVKKAARTLQLSGRGILKTLRVARTIADADNSPSVLPAHVAEALQFRSFHYDH